MSAFDGLTAGLKNVPDWWTLYDAWHRSFYKRATNYPTTEDAFTEGFALGKAERATEIEAKLNQMTQSYQAGLLVRDQLAVEVSRLNQIIAQQNHSINELIEEAGCR